MSTQRQALTQSDIEHLDDLLQRGEIDAFYHDLAAKDYRSATWAKKEFEKATRYGAENTIFLEKQSGQRLDKTATDELKQSLADQIFQRFAAKVDKGQGQKRSHYGCLYYEK